MGPTVALINPPYLPRYSRCQRSPAVTRSGTLYYPMWLSYATGYLKQQGCTPWLVDAPAQGLGVEDVVTRVQTWRPSLVVLETSTPSISNDLEVAKQIKEACPGAFLLLVGTHVSALPGETLGSAPWVDAVARGEYELTVHEVALSVSGGGAAEGIAGLSYGSDGKVIHNPERQPLEDLDALPMVAQVYLEHLRVEDYFNPNALYPMVATVASRGCPHRCSFCVYPQTFSGRRARRRSPGSVAEEMEFVEHEIPKARAVFFEDDTLALSGTHLSALCREISARNLSLSWTANVRADLDGEGLRLLHDAGCRMVCVGFESGSQRLLDECRKGIRLEQSREFMANAKALGLLVHGCFMVGFPGETGATMQETLDLALDLDPDTAQFYPMMVYPGTEAYGRAKEEGRLVTEEYSRWLDAKGRHNCVIRTEALTEQDLVDFCRHARRRFYLRGRYLRRKCGQYVRQPQERARLKKAFGTFWRHLLH
jgi:anaerobic magnesium-protoporphyrin IX monomethyl ester cyclase